MIIYVLHFSCRRNEMVLKFWLLVRVTALKQYDVLESRSKNLFIFLLLPGDPCQLYMAAHVFFCREYILRLEQKEVQTSKKT